MKQVWYVLGSPDEDVMPVLFETKMAAEMYTRQLWPDASPQDRYARVFYKSVWTEADMKEHANHGVTN